MYRSASNLPSITSHVFTTYFTKEDHLEKSGLTTTSKFLKTVRVPAGGKRQHKCWVRAVRGSGPAEVFMETQWEIKVSQATQSLQRKVQPTWEYITIAPHLKHTHRLNVSKTLDGTFECSKQYFQNDISIWDHTNSAENILIKQEMERWIFWSHAVSCKFGYRQSLSFTTLNVCLWKTFQFMDINWLSEHLTTWCT